MGLWSRPACHTLLKVLNISSTTARVAPDPLRVLEFYQIQLSEDLKLIEKTWNHTGNEKKSHISRGDQQAYYLHRFRRSYHGKKTNMAVVFSRGPLTQVLKYRGHRWCHPTIWKTSFLQTHIEEFNKHAEKFRLTVLRSNYWNTIKARCIWWTKVSYKIFKGRLCNFRLVLGAKQGEEINQSSRSEFSEKLSANNFTGDNTSGPRRTVFSCYYIFILKQFFYFLPSFLKKYISTL